MPEGSAEPTTDPTVEPAIEPAVEPAIEPPNGGWPPGVDLDPEGGRTVHGTLGIRAVEVTADRVVLTLPVTPAVHQPYGILHGGVSALLAESAASFGGAMAAGAGHHVVGIELNASHLRPVRQGTLTATATPVRKGRTVQVWEIILTDDDERETCRARCTLAVLEGNPPR